MIKRILERLYHFILPGKCMFCDRELKKNINVHYCSECISKLPFKREKRCLICQREIFGEGNIKLCNICGNRKMHFDVNYSPFRYEGSIESAIKRFKFADRMWYGKYFAGYMAEELSDKRIEADYIVYPPVNRKTYRERGYNQAELLAVSLSEKIKVPCIKNAFSKTRQNKKQSLQKAKTRFENVKGVFRLSKKAEKLIKDKTIIFADDIMTTGATASECAKILKKAGARMVISATIAIT